MKSEPRVQACEWVRRQGVDPWRVPRRNGVYLLGPVAVFRRYFGRGKHRSLKPNRRGVLMSPPAIRWIGRDRLNEEVRRWMRD